MLTRLLFALILLALVPSCSSTQRPPAPTPIAPSTPGPSAAPDADAATDWTTRPGCWGQLDAAHLVIADDALTMRRLTAALEQCSGELDSCESQPVPELPEIPDWMTSVPIWVWPTAVAVMLIAAGGGYVAGRSNR